MGRKLVVEEMADQVPAVPGGLMEEDRAKVMHERETS